MMRRVLPGILLLAAACGENGPRAGELELRLQGPLPPRAAIIELVGAHQGVTVPTGTPYQLTELAGGGDTTRLLLVAPVNGGLTGAVARIQVNDVGRAARYSARLVEGAGPTYALVPAQQYTVTIAVP